MSDKENEEVFSGDYLGLFESGEIGISDGCGFIGWMEQEETRQLYLALKQVYGE